MTLTEYHTTLVEAITAHFGDSLNTVKSYFNPHQSEDQNAGLLLSTPAALIEIERLSLPEGADRGDGTDAVECHIVIHCILSTQTEDLQLELRHFAAEMVRLVATSGFVPCRDVGQLTDVDALPGIFKTGQSGYDSFAVTFRQVIYLGETVWKPASPPREIYFGRSVDEQNITGYEKVYEQSS